MDPKYLELGGQILNLDFCSSSRDLVALLSSGHLLFFDLESIAEYGEARLRTSFEIGIENTAPRLIKLSSNTKWAAVTYLDGQVLRDQVPKFIFFFVILVHNPSH